jgi:hypothetical protein
MVGQDLQAIQSLRTGCEEAQATTAWLNKRLLLATFKQGESRKSLCWRSILLIAFM